jgi:polysaccharide biosynthesis protein PslH
MNILYLTTVLPNNKRTGGEIASQAFIETLLKDRHHVKVLGYTRSHDNYIIQSHELSVEVRHIETQKAGYRTLLWFAKAFLLQLPYSVAKYHSQAYINRLRSMFTNHNYDVVILEHSQMGWLLPHVQHAKLIFITQNVEHELYQQQSQEAKGLRKWILEREARLIKPIEAALAKQVNQIWTLTNYDAQSFNDLSHSKKAYSLPIPSSIIAQNSDISKTIDIGLLGTWTWQANLEGLKWFLNKVCPLLPESVSIHIAGKGTEALSASKNVHFLGFVANATAFLQATRVVVIPSTHGGGIQIKTLDAIATGSAIVATSFALRGIENYPDSIHVADTPEHFANKILDSLHMAPVYDTSLIIWSENRRASFRNTLEIALQALSDSSN